MQYSRYHPKSNSDKIPSVNLSRQNLKKTPPNQSLRERSAKPNQLPQILKDYKQFCDKYFNTHSNQSQNAQSAVAPQYNFPSFSMSNHYSPEQETQVKAQTQIQAQAKLSFIEETDFGFFQNAVVNSNEQISKINIQWDKQSIGFKKNNKSDYEQRKKKILKKTDKNTDEDEDNNEAQYEDEFNFKDELEIDNKEKGKEKERENVISIEDKSNENDKNIINDNSNEDNTQNKDKDNKANNNNYNVNNNNPIKIFDESTHNIINEEIRNQNASKIQIYYKSRHQPRENRKNRIFFGYDKTSRFIVSIYIAKRSPPNTDEPEEEFNIFSLLFKIFSFETHSVKCEKKDIKDLLFNNSITNKQINQVIPDMVEKVLKQDKEESSGYDFEEIQSEKVIPHEIHQSISSIGQFDYDNI